MDSFYVTLPSNSSVDIYPDNALSHYSVNLPTALSFEGDWEVSLAEITYPRRWLNIVEGHNHIYCNAEETGGGIHIHHIPEGFYQTPDDLIAKITPPIGHGDKIRLKYNKYLQKVIVRTDDDVHITFAERMGYLFGFEKAMSITGIEKAPHVVDMKQIHSLFVYTDIFEYNIVGDTRAPLLRNVSVEGEYGDIVTKTYDSPHYVPLKQRFMSTIHIDIRDDVGHFIQFIGGKVIVKLHFRKRRSTYFN